MFVIVVFIRHFSLWWWLFLFRLDWWFTFKRKYCIKNIGSSLSNNEINKLKYIPQARIHHFWLQIKIQHFESIKQTLYPIPCNRKHHQSSGLIVKFFGKRINSSISWWYITTVGWISEYKWLLYHSAICWYFDEKWLWFSHHYNVEFIEERC